MKQDINQKEPSGSVQQQEPAGTRTADTKKEPVQASRPRRKMKSGPHIYGQEDGGINAQEYGRQGTGRSFRGVQEDSPEESGTEPAGTSGRPDGGTAAAPGKSGAGKTCASGRPGTGPAHASGQPDDGTAAASGQSGPGNGRKADDACFRISAASGDGDSEGNAEIPDLSRDLCAVYD